MSKVIMTVKELTKLLESGEADYKKITVWCIFGTGKGEAFGVIVTPAQALSSICDIIPETEIECDITQGNVDIGRSRLP